MSRTTPNKEMAYYLTVFKLKGHETWRAHLGREKETFIIEQKNWPSDVKVTDIVVHRVDRITGLIEKIS